jgi:hypothetical protein
MTRPELNTPLGHPTVRGRDIRYQDGCGKQRKRLDEILQRPRQASRHAGHSPSASYLDWYKSYSPRMLQACNAAMSGRRVLAMSLCLR